MKTTTNVYLLSSNEKATKLGDLYNNTQSLLKLKSWEGLADNVTYNKLHIYITLPQSDLEISKIKKDDWFFTAWGKIFKCTGVDNYHILYDNGQYLPRSCEKIIASTDKTLIKFNVAERRGSFSHFSSLPTIPESFITYFIEQYNKGNVLKNVDVELIEYLENIGFFKKLKHTYELELTPNNEVVVNIPIIECK